MNEEQAVKEPLGLNDYVGVAIIFVLGHPLSTTLPLGIGVFVSLNHRLLGCAFLVFAIIAMAFKMGTFYGRTLMAQNVIASLDELNELNAQFMQKPGAVWPDYGDWPVTKESEIMHRLRAKVESPQ